MVIPTPYHSWFLHPILCWFEPAFPYDAFQLYYTARAASHFEDAMYLWVNGTTYSRASVTSDHSYSSQNELDSESKGHEHNPDSVMSSRKHASVIPVLSTRKERADAEAMRGLHHNLSCLLATMSFFCGYAKIGSLVMIIHDISEIPVDFFMLFSLNGWRILQIATLSIAIPVWIYWRLWLYPITVLHTVTFQSKSFLDGHSCEPGNCSWLETPERAPFLLCLIIVLALNLIWLMRMFKRGYRLLNFTQSA